MNEEKKDIVEKMLDDAPEKDFTPEPTEPAPKKESINEINRKFRPVDLEEMKMMLNIPEDARIVSYSIYPKTNRHFPGGMVTYSTPSMQPTSKRYLRKG